MKKTCSRCGEEKGMEEFNRDKSRKDGRYIYCKKCTRKYNQEYLKGNREKYDPRNAPDYKKCPSCEDVLPKERFSTDRSSPDGLKWHCRECNAPKRHGITIERYREMISKGCAICGSNERLCVDHNHECCSGKFGCPECVRGVLCNQCNLAIGYMNEDSERLKAAIAYLEKYQNGQN